MKEILVVDDSRLARQTLRQMLERADYDRLLQGLEQSKQWEQAEVGRSEPRPTGAEIGGEGQSG